MAIAQANGIAIGYEVSGPADGTPLLLIHGLGAQLVRWPPGFVALLEERGYRTIRIDNRDTGLSTHFHDAPMPDFTKIGPGSTDIPYSLSDMAGDAVGLLDALGIAAAHVVGVSLGGMITQTMAIEHPARVASATIMMSQNGNPAMPGTSPEAMGVLTTPAPDPFADREAFLVHQVHLNQALGSPDYPTPVEELRALCWLAAERSTDPAGAARQLAAAMAIPDLRPGLRGLSTPSLVIHGADDPLLSHVHGQDIAEAIPGAWYLKVNGMGHDLPPQLFDLFERAIAANCARAG